MQHAEFDHDAPLELPVPTGPVRIPATPDQTGTQALFGEPVRTPAVRGSRPHSPAATDGQDQLF
ncbi:hypothetical protein OG430_33700 [Streptomyces sp. NBC_01304]|nr:hypothetical protein OG430_33700 [Streptomyces sp. NBC_01304]